jgi:hypothetical protein
VEATGGAASRGPHSLHDCRRFGASNLLHIRGGPHGRDAGLAPLDWSQPRFPNNDRIIFSKGYACPVLYSMFKAVGAITDPVLLRVGYASRCGGRCDMN